MSYYLNIYIHTINDIIVSSFLYLLLNSARDACNSKRIKPRIRFSAETKKYKLFININNILHICVQLSSTIFMN